MLTPINVPLNAKSIRRLITVVVEMVGDLKNTNTRIMMFSSCEKLLIGSTPLDANVEKLTKEGFQDPQTFYSRG